MRRQRLGRAETSMDAFRSPRAALAPVGRTPVAACLLAGLVTGCTGPQSTFAGAGVEAESVAFLFWVMVAGAVVIWVLVIGLSIYVTKAHPAAFSEAAGLRLIIWGGGVFPVVVLAALLAWGLAIMPDFRREADGPVIAVSAERFWWRIAYDVEGEPGVAKSLPAGGVESANELWLPVGRRSEILIGSPDVIHSLWVPAIAGKTDAIPGRVNRLVLEPTREGVYNGVCAEFCGDAHAQMGLRVIVVPEEEYAAYVARQAEPASVTAGPGPELFLARGCAACHTVRGTPADGQVGPDLTHVASRRTIAAGLLDTSEAAIAAFVRAPDHLKPGAEMPAFAALPDEEIAAIAAWLGELR
ncbi:MAG TPA: cytochrome c oxidase subunit II [Aurantimonas sp.]|nr:cytochrome c oxidase subunit II [Aurantimonas sp.]